MSDHSFIFLEPYFENEDRTWCQDDVYDPADYRQRKSTKYIRADLYDQLEQQLKDMAELIIWMEESDLFGVDRDELHLYLKLEHLEVLKKARELCR